PGITLVGEAVGDVEGHRDAVLLAHLVCPAVLPQRETPLEDGAAGENLPNLPVVDALRVAAELCEIDFACHGCTCICLGALKRCPRGVGELLLSPRRVG